MPRFYWDVHISNHSVFRNPDHIDKPLLVAGGTGPMAIVVESCFQVGANRAVATVPGLQGQRATLGATETTYAKRSMYVTYP